MHHLNLPVAAGGLTNSRQGGILHHFGVLSGVGTAVGSGLLSAALAGDCVSVSVVVAMELLLRLCGVLFHGLRRPWPRERVLQTWTRRSRPPTAVGIE